MVYCVAEKYFPRQLTLASCHTSPHDHYVERACDSCVVVLQKLIRTWWLSCRYYVQFGTYGPFRYVCLYFN